MSGHYPPGNLNMSDEHYWAVERVNKALDLAQNLGGFDGAHHKMYAIDQIVRALTGCPVVTETAKDSRGETYSYERQGESAHYLEWVRQRKAGSDGPDTYDWDIGCPP